MVGGGNSGAQIVAEIAQGYHALWVTTKDPLFLQDDVDGRVLFEQAVAGLKAGPNDTSVGGIGDIVMVPPVKEARARGDLNSVRPFKQVTANGRKAAKSLIVSTTGFRILQIVAERPRWVGHGRLIVAISQPYCYSESASEPARWNQNCFKAYI